MILLSFINGDIMPKNKVIEQKLSVLPHTPGVYIMKNSQGNIIYVGKSKNLKNRVSSYFQSTDKLSLKTIKLVNNIQDFDIITTDTETDALILENELIKKHIPKYNIKLKDSKQYPYIKITNEPFPKLLIAHERKNDKCKYFGPYTSSISAKDIIKTVQKTFSLPSCDKKFNYGKSLGRPCLNYHINQCTAPCSGKISAKEFSEVFAEIEMVLKGDYSSAEKSLEKKMLDAAENMNFEAAAKHRDSIKNLKKLSTHQKIKSKPGIDKDVFGFYETETNSVMVILYIREGIVIDKNVVYINNDEITDAETLSDFILRYYSCPETIPKNIYLSFTLQQDQILSISNILKDKSGHIVEINTPKSGVNKKLCDMALQNATEALKAKEKQDENDISVLIKLAQTLNLEIIPETIESYDISNSGDSDIYCGMIVIENGKFKKSNYRAFLIKTTEGVDDYGAMREALTRRFMHLKNSESTSSLSTPPDLILLDGGAGQVSVVREVAKQLGINIPIFGMVKDKFHKTRTITDGDAEISIAKDNLLFSFIYKIQEEVHRFSFSKMDAARRKKMKKLELTQIKGIGEAKAKAIYNKFKTLDNLRNASMEELCSIKGVNPDIAQKILDFLKNEMEK